MSPILRSESSPVSSVFSSATAMGGGLHGSAVLTPFSREPSWVGCWSDGSWPSTTKRKGMQEACQFLSSFRLASPACCPLPCSGNPEAEKHIFCQSRCQAVSRRQSLLASSLQARAVSGPSGACPSFGFRIVRMLMEEVRKKLLRSPD